MPRHSKILAALTALTVLVTATAAAQQKSDDSFHWTGTLAAGKTLRIQDVNGSIKATGTSSNEASVSAVRRSKKSDPASVEIRVAQDGDVTVICAIWPNQQDADGCQERSHHDDHWSKNDVSVEFTVSVPAGVRFEGSTVNGSVGAGGLTADAEVTSVNGDVTLATQGTGSAATVNGDVRLTMGTSTWTGDLEAKTVNGSVTVEMPTPANLDVRANTLNGDITRKVRPISG